MLPLPLALAFGLSLPLRAAQQAAAPQGALFAAPSPVLVTAVSDLLASRTGQGLVKVDPFWSGLDLYLKGDMRFGTQILAPVLESLPQGAAQSLPRALTLGDIDASPEAARLRMIETFALARAKASELVEAKVRERLSRSAQWTTIAEWKALETDLAPYARYSGYPEAAYYSARRMVSALALLRAEYALSAEMLRLTAVSERDQDGNVVLHQSRLSADQDWADAVALLRRAVFEKDKEAMHGLGTMHELGWGKLVVKDQARAAEWFGEAAATDIQYGVVKDGGGHPAAQLSLARMYEEGRGVPRTFSTAYQLYSLARGRGVLEARAGLERLASGAHPDAVAGARAAAESVRGRKPFEPLPSRGFSIQLEELSRLKESEQKQRGLLNLFWGMVLAPFSLGLLIVGRFPLGLGLVAAVNLALYGLIRWSTRAQRARARELLREALARAEVP